MLKVEIQVERGTRSIVHRRQSMSVKQSVRKSLIIIITAMIIHVTIVPAVNLEDGNLYLVQGIFMFFPDMYRFRHIVYRNTPSSYPGFPPAMF